MRLKPGQLSQHLKRGLKALYTISGDELLLVSEAADAIISAAREAGYENREIILVETGFDWRNLKKYSGNTSLFSSRRLLEIRLPSGKPGTQGAQALLDYCAALPPETLTLIILPKLDRQTLASKWCKALLDAGDSVFVSAVERKELGPWIAQRLAAQDQQIDMVTQRLLADLVENNLLAAYQEVQKLGLIYPPGRLTLAQVTEAVLDVARYDVFKFLDAILEGDTLRTQKMLTGLKEEGAEPLFILAMLSKEIRSLIKVKSSMMEGRSFQEACRATGIWETRMTSVKTASTRLDLDELLAVLRLLAQVDKAVKGVGSGDAWEMLSRISLKLCRPDKLFSFALE